jgi:hypothetical protein
VSRSLLAAGPHPAGAANPHAAGAVAPLGPADRQPGAFGLADIGIVVGLVVCGVALPALLASSLHAFSIPRNDDWAYRRVLWHFVRTGNLSFVGWGAMTLVGQVLWAAPFALLLGDHAWVPGLSVAVVAAIGLAAAYALARSLLPRAWAAGCVLVTVAFPGFALNTSSFMTDVPAFSASAVCLALGSAAMQRRGRAYWAFVTLSMMAGFAGFCTREFDLAAPVAVLVCLTAREPSRWRSHAGAGLVLLAACGGLYCLVETVPGAQHDSLVLPGAAAIRGLVACYFTACFALSPLLPTALRHRVSRARRSEGPSVAWPRALAALAVLALGILALARGWAIFPGNYLTQQGAMATEVLPGSRPDLFSGPVFAALEYIAVASGLALVLVLGGARDRAGRGPLSSLGTGRGLTCLFVGLTAGGAALYGLFVRAALWDRYTWPLIFGMAVLVATSALGAAVAADGASVPKHSRRRTPGTWVRRWRLQRGGIVASVSLAVVVALVTSAVTVDADAYDGARWHGGELAVKQGFAATTVDAGFEWVGSHNPARAVRGRQVPGSPAYESWYDQMFPGFRDCAFVSGSRWAAPGLRPIGTVGYDELGLALPARLYVYTVAQPHCPDPSR